MHMAGAGPDPLGSLCRKHSYGGSSFTIRRGDYAPLMGRVIKALEDSLPFCEGSTQTKMVESYIASFKLGSIDDHKEGSRQWIKDKGPAVESYIGFIESYRDPSGARGYTYICIYIYIYIESYRDPSGAHGEWYTYTYIYTYIYIHIHTHIHTHIHAHIHMRTATCQVHVASGLT